MKELSKKILESKYLPVAISVFIFIILYLFRSISYDDWDSIQFALAIDNFDMTLHQPHPPGYPVYIFVLKVINSVFQNPLESMLFLSILSGSISSFLIFKIGEIVFPKKRHFSLLLMLLFATFPLVSTNSVKAMSDMFSLMFYITWLYSVIRIAMLDKRSLIDFAILGVISGISLGIRIQIFTAIIVPMLILAVLMIKNFKEYKSQIVVLITSGMLAVFSWLIPTILISGGLTNYINLLKGQYLWRYEIHAHTPFENGFDILYFLEHGFSHVYSFIRGAFGFALPWNNVSDIPDGILYALIAVTSLLIIGLIYLLIKKVKNFYVKLFILSCIPYLIFMYMNLNYENPRYWLPFIPWLILAIVYGISKIKYSWLQAIISVSLLAFFTFQSFSLLSILKNEESPPTQAINHISEEFELEEVAFISCAHMNERHFQYLTPFEITFYEEYTYQDLLELSEDGMNLVSCQCWKPIEEVEGTYIIDSWEFYRDVRAHWKHSYIEICEVGVE